MTTLTPEALRQRHERKPIYIDDVPGWGRVGVRKRSEVQHMRRLYAELDDNGKYIPHIREKRRIYSVIDQIVTEDGSLMFSDSDVAWMQDLDQDALDPLMLAIVAAIGDDQKKEPAESDVAETNSEETNG